ncbi:Oligosaccharide translocation protein rft1 [Trapelia coarctata]|nr:Oligosaccharide translocation protein rft1 [Trapelia coarctata]
MSTKSPKSDTQSRLLANSARGATFLICLQIGSRALTFVVNQILLRYLSPELLAISSQLELYAISVLYFARESLRVALQRQGGGSPEGKDAESTKNSGDKEDRGVYKHTRAEKKNNMAESYPPSLRAQEGVNLSYIAVALGPLLAFIFARLYLGNAEPAVLATPYMHRSLSLYALATTLELLIEPCFVVAQQQMLYGLRASAETSATFTRCVLTCATAIWASSSRQDLGVLPFALGQLGYALVLNMVYYSNVWSKSTKGGFSLVPRSLSSNIPSQYILSLFSRPTLTLAINLYAQSGLKHLLTQGDSLLIALFTSLSSQGVYALASNYGSLLARLLFQPIEESSRGVFGRLLSNAPASSSPMTPSSTPPAPSKTPTPAVLSAHTYLTTLLHLYSLLSLLLLTTAPTLAPLLLTSIAGPRWSHTAAGSVLSLYCYYLPLLALNGILEAFVSAVASPAQLRTQSAWMLAFSAGFAGAGYLLLRVWGLGARGLVLANAVNMGMRILWSWGFVRGFLRGEGVGLRIAESLPARGSMGLGVLVAAYLRVLQDGFQGGWMDLVKTVGVGGFYGLAL